MHFLNNKDDHLVTETRVKELFNSWELGNNISVFVTKTLHAVQDIFANPYL